MHQGSFSIFHKIPKEERLIDASFCVMLSHRERQHPYARNDLYRLMPNLSILAHETYLLMRSIWREY